jgi:hypothetical protein
VGLCLWTRLQAPRTQRVASRTAYAASGIQGSVSRSLMAQGVGLTRIAHGLIRFSSE